MSQNASLLLVALGAVLGLILLIARFKLNAFIALMLASLFVGVCSGMKLADVPKSFLEGVGKVLGDIAVVIGLGTILGKMLAESGGAEVVANRLVRALGKERLDWAMMFVAFIVGIPVFFAVGLVLLVPIVFTLARETRTPLLRMAIPLGAGVADAPGDSGGSRAAQGSFVATVRGCYRASGGGDAGRRPVLVLFIWFCSRFLPRCIVEIRQRLPRAGGVDVAGGGGGRRIQQGPRPGRRRESDCRTCPGSAPFAIVARLARRGVDSGGDRFGDRGDHHGGRNCGADCGRHTGCPPGTVDHRDGRRFVDPLARERR